MPIDISIQHAARREIAKELEVDTGGTWNSFTSTLAFSYFFTLCVSTLRVRGTCRCFQIAFWIQIAAGAYHLERSLLHGTR